MKKWVTYTRGPSGHCSQAEGGATRGSRIRMLVRLRSFDPVNMLAARIGSIEVGLLSVRFAKVSIGTRRGKIVDCGGCLAVGSEV
jgi:hypothetical protein